MRKGLFAVAVVALAACPCSGRDGVSASHLRDSTADLRPDHLGDRLVFEANRGQVASRFRFVCRARGFTGLLEDRGVTFVLPAVPGRPARGASIVSLRFVGAREDSRARSTLPLSGRSHYLRGSDPSLWIRDVPHHAGIEVSSLYDGVDVRWYGDDRGRLRYDLVVYPGGTADHVAMEFLGSRAVHVGPEGELLVRAEHGTLRHDRPVLYQEEGGRRLPVGGGYAVRPDGRVGFTVGAHRRDLPLVIDPPISYATYLGGTSSDQGGALALEARPETPAAPVGMR